jgi:regulator of sigma E protease
MDILIQTISIAFWFIVILIPLVGIHEFGHLLVARLFGVKVLEYGIGIPPRWIYTRWKGIVWSLNFIPLGGFAKIYGDHDALDDAADLAKTDPKAARQTYLQSRAAELITNQDLRFFLEENNLEYSTDWVKFESQNGQPKAGEEDTFSTLQKQLDTLIGWEFDTKLDSKDAFFNKSWIAQAAILLAGVTFNLATAFLLYVALFNFVSTPAAPVLLDDLQDIKNNAQITQQSDNITVFSVIKDSPAYQAGLRPGDELISLAGKNLKEVANFDQFRQIVRDNKDNEVDMTFRSAKSGETLTRKIKFQISDGQPLFGVRSDGFGYTVRYKSKDFLGGVTLAGQTVGRIFVLNYESLGKILVALLPTTQDKSALETLGGPIAVGSISGTVFNLQGFAGILNIMAVISVSLAAFNLLPIPALDGGRLLIITLNKIFRRRNKKLEAMVISGTFILLLVVMVLVAVKDITGIATGKF